MKMMGEGHKDSSTKGITESYGNDKYFSFLELTSIPLIKTDETLQEFDSKPTKQAAGFVKTIEE